MDDIVVTEWSQILDVWKSGQELLPEVFRWKNYQEDNFAKSRPQNDLQHSYSICILLRIFLLMVDQEIGILDSQFVDDALKVHEHGEGERSEDVLYKNKNPLDDLREYEAFIKRYDQLPSKVFNYFERAFLLQFALVNPENFPENAREIMSYLANHYELECYVFDAVERWDYVLYGIEQYKEHGHTKGLVQILRNQIPKLNLIADDLLPAFGKYIWTPAIRNSCQHFVDSYEGQWIEQKGEK